MSTPRTLQAFDAEAIQAGNFAHRIDHEKVARETDAILERMSLTQKIHEIRGLQPIPIEEMWWAGGDEDLGLAPWKMVDGPRGARAGTATAFPVAIARSASFDMDLERRVGMAIGLEVAAKGGNVLLAPTINLLRHPGWGRAQETYSEDTHHTGAMGAAFVSGAQNHVLASVKHFALNNLENTRFELSAEVDDRSLHEVYLPHFERCVVEAGVASVMTAYNKVNGTYCCENPELLGVLADWGFRGFVESDWYLGTKSTAEALRAGLDIEMPHGFRRDDDKLEEALAAGETSEADIHRAARHSVYQKVAWQLRNDGVAGQPRPDASVVECEEHVALAREAAEKSIVLLKNQDDVLPISREAGVRIAVVGDLAREVNLGDRGSSMVTSSEITTPWAGIEAAAGAATVEHFASDADLSGLADFDVCVVVTGLSYRDEGEFIPTAQQEAEGSDLARGGDRETLDLPAAQRDLIERVSDAARRVVVVLQGGSAIVVRPWIDGVDGLLMAWYGGREGGHALARVLYGEVSPSGRLPVSFPRHTDDLMPWDVSSLAVDHDLLHGYRWLDQHGVQPEFAFGYGLSYTRFELSSLRVERGRAGFRCLVDVRNSGARAGATVVQLYVSCRESEHFRVEKELKGFGRIELEVGEVATLQLDVADRDLRIYDRASREWLLENARYLFRVGESSEDLPLDAEWICGSGAWQLDTKLREPDRTGFEQHRTVSYASSPARREQRSRAMAIKVGDRIPDVTLKTMKDGAIADVKTAELFGGRKVVLFSVPGAFTPTCSAKHLPGFVEQADAIRAKGVDEIVCVSVNDVFVMGAWADAQGSGDKVTLLADGNGEFARAIGLDFDGSNFGMGTRSQRFAAVVEDGELTLLNVEAPAKFEVSDADTILAAL